MRPIDADALHDMISDNACHDIMCVTDVLDFIKIMSTLDYAPVRHERWKAITRQEARNYAPFGLAFCDDNFICTGCGHFEVFRIASRRQVLPQLRREDGWREKGWLNGSA